MKAWLPPQIPHLPDPGPIPQLYDTATRGLRSSLLGSGSADVAGPARLYVCGITPYDSTHIGHAATYVTFDLLVRAWKDAGLQVRYVQNVTDVDDPLLERANDTGENWEALAERQVELFRTDMAALRVVPPDYYVGVVEAMPLVLDLVERLRERGTVYELDSDLYFRIDGDREFGTVSGLDRPTMLELSAERGGDPNRPGKKDPLDSLLWQHERPGEPAWDSPYGRGRPGWHTECAAIAMHHLGAVFDVQGGGSDLAFPHHELSTAQLRATSDATLPAPAYVHQAMVGLDGEKMSKSRGNLVFVSGLREDGVDPMAIRLALLARPYREDWEWTPDGLGEAEGRLARWRSAIAGPGPDAAPVLAAVRTALANDLDAPAAVAAIDDWASRALAGDGADREAGDLIRRTADALLGVAL